SVDPATSTCSSPSSPTPTSTICPSTTATSASATAAPVPSKTRPPANTVLTWAPFPRSCRRDKPIAAASIRTVEGQYVAYSFYRIDPAWRRLAVEERQAHKDEFAEVVDSFAERFEHLRAYSTAGVRPDCDFFLWKITERYDDLGELGTALNGTALAGWLETTYSYLATTKASQYTSARKARKITP